MTQTPTPGTPTQGPTPPASFWQRFRDLGSLRRSTDGRAVAGVAEGLSRHFDVDPVVVRVLFAALAVFGGAGFALYGVLWLTVPRDDSQDSIMSARLNRDSQAWMTIGLVVGIVLAGAVLFGSISWAMPHPFPLLLIVLVVMIAYFALSGHGARRQPPPIHPGTPGFPGYPGTPVPPPSAGPSESTTPYSTPDPTTAPTYPMTSQETSRTLVTAGMTQVLPVASAVTAVNAGPDELTQPVGSRAWWERDEGPTVGIPVAPYAPTVPPFVAPPPPPRPPRSHLFAITMAVIAIALACVWAVDAGTSYDVDPSVYPGTALVVIALGLFLGTWWGRSRGLIAMGIIAALLTGIAAMAGPGPYGDNTASPTQASQLRPTYAMGIGRFTLHLEHVADIGNLTGQVVTVTQRIGQLRLVVPSSLAVTVDATVDHGSIEGPRGVENIDNGGAHIVMTPAADGRPTLVVQLNLTYGDIEIVREACPGAGAPAAGESTKPWNGARHVTAACS